MRTLTHATHVPVQRRASSGPERRTGRHPSWGEVAAEAASDIMGSAEAGSVQRMLLDLQGSAGNDAVQRLVKSHQAPPADLVAQRVRAATGSGRPLDAVVRRQVEPIVGADLSGVRVHDDSESDALAGSLGAQAFTTGHDMFFSRGAYDPGSDGGLKTIAHEATHVVQQSRGEVAGTPIGGGLSLSEPGDPFERHADEVAGHVGSGPDHVGSGPPPGPAPARAGGQKTAQRKCGCGGSCGPCGGQRQEQDEGGAAPGAAPLQRLATPSAGAPVLVQRKVAASPVDINFRASADLDSRGATGLNTNGASGFDPSTELSPLNPREVPERLRFNVDIDWKPSAAQKKKTEGGGPLSCDPCKVLDTVKAIPDRYKRECKEDNCTFKERKDFVKKLIPELLQHPCKWTATASGEAICSTTSDVASTVCSFIPFCTAIANTIKTVSDIIKNAATAVGNVLDVVDGMSSKLCKDKQFCEDEDSPENQGEAHIKSTTMFVLTKQGDNDVLVPSGPIPNATSDGKGAQLSIPVQIERESTQRAARVSIAPAVVTTGGGSEAHVNQKSFFVDVKLLPKPAPVDIKCTQVSVPFVIASTKYMSPPKGLGEDGERQRLFNWYFDLQPAVRNEIEEGRALVKLTGRCSTTGSKTFNLDLARKRAEKVRDIISNFTGNNARLRFFATGEFVSGPDNKEDDTQRRVDIAVEGQVPGESVTGVSDICVGGLGQPTKGGANIEPKVETETTSGGNGATSAPPEVAPEFEPAGFEPATTGAIADSGESGVVDLGEQIPAEVGGGENFEPMSLDDQVPVDLEVPEMAGVGAGGGGGGFSDFFDDFF